MRPDRFVGRTFGDFVLRERMGEGGFGVVYRASQPLLDREAVIKVLRAPLRGKQVVIDRFLREARLASKLDHPYAAHIYAFGAENDGELWIAMELVRGTPLDRLLVASGPLSLERFVPLFERMCEVVHTAHEQGIVHRDIKPANVMVLSRAGRLLPKLLDFGIAKALVQSTRTESVEQTLDGTDDDDLPDPDLATDDTLMPDRPGQRTVPTVESDGLTQRGVVMGSPQYMAPEQWVDAGGVDARTDLYALAILAYQALTGRLPFVGNTLSAIAYAHATEPVPPLGDGMSRALDAVFAKALAKKPADRFADALVMAEAMRTASGIGEKRPALPMLEDDIKERALGEAPQPIAEAVAVLEAARNAHQARDALRQLTRTLVRYLGLLAIASRTRIGSRAGDPPPVAEALRELYRHGLSDARWLELARDLVNVFRSQRDAFPVPELIDVFFDGDGRATAVERLEGLIAMRETAEAIADDHQLIELLARGCAEASRLLRDLAFIFEYTLVITISDGLGERWMGVRRASRATIVVRGKPLAPDLPVLVDKDGAPTLTLAPLVQVHAPTPGAPLDVFLFEGRGRQGAKLVALPLGFEHHDDTFWDWFRAQLSGSLDESATDSAGERSPYRGLSAFSREDAAMFFGREKLVDAFLNRLRVQPLLAVVGRSGAGKSSFVQAGVIPSLPADWRALVVRPGFSPCAALASRLQQAGIDASELRSGIETDPDALGDLLRADAAKRGPLLLVIDQLEELFTLCANEDERRLFAEALSAATRAVDEPIRVVFTIRDDFLVRAEQVPALRNRIGQGLQLLTVPVAEDLLRILVEPARRAGYDFEDAELPAEMVREVADQPGALALLSFTALKLWDARDRHFKQLTRKAYRALGGVGGALAQHAEKTLEEMPPEARRLTREAFRHLVTSQQTRAIIPRKELSQLLGVGAHADALIESLIAARLVVASETESGEDDLEIVHEALLSAWPRLVTWRREDQEGARFREQLRSAAKQWDERGRPKGLVWRGEALAELVVWRAKHPTPLTPVESAFVAASLADATRGRRIRRGLLVATILTLGIGLTVMFQLSQRTEEQRAIAHRRLVASYVDQGRQALMASEHSRAAAYLLEARRIGGETTALRFMLERATKPLSAHHLALELDAGSVWGTDYSPDGEWIATAHDNGKVALWHASDGSRRVVLDAARGTAFDVAFFPDSARLATAGADGRVRIWNTSGQELASKRPLDAPVETVELTAAGVVIAGGWGGHVLVWKPDGDKHVLHELGAKGESYVAVSTDGSKIAALVKSSPLVTIFDVASGERIAQRTAPANARAAAFSPDGRRLAVADSSGTATIWDLDKPEPRLSIAGHDGILDHLAYSPDGRLLVTAGRDRVARVWDAESGRKVSVLGGHVGIVWRARFSADSRLVLTLGGAGDAAIWEAASGRRVALLEGHTSLIFDGGFTRRGDRVVTSSWDGLAHEWAVHDHYRIVEHPGFTQQCVDRVAHGQWIAIACLDGTRAWNLDGDRFDLPAAQGVALSANGQLAAFSGATVWQWHAPNTHMELPHAVAVAAIAISADGKRIATLDEARVLRMWHAGTRVWERSAPASRSLAFAPSGDVIAGGDFETPAAELARFSRDTGAPLPPLALAAPATGVTIVDDGRYLITMGQVLEVWDLETQRRVSSLAGHVGAVSEVRLSADRSQLITTSGDATARIWRFPSGELIAVLAGSPQYLLSADFAPSGNLVATTGGDSMTRFWDPSSGQLLWTLASREPDTLVRFSDDHALVTLGVHAGFAKWDLSTPLVLDTLLERGLPCWVPWQFDRESGRAIPRDGDGCP